MVTHKIYKGGCSRESDRNGSDKVQSKLSRYKKMRTKEDRESGKEEVTAKLEF